MRKIYILFYFITLTSFSQNNSSKSTFSCEDIKNFKIKDSSLYDEMPNGKLVFAAYKSKSNVYKVIINESNYFYVSKQLMRKIRRSIRKNKCINLKISKLKNTKDVELIRD